MRMRIQVGQDSQRTAGAQHSDGFARRALFVDGAIAETRPDLFNHFFDARVVNRTDQETGWIFERRPAKTQKFPGAQMSGQENDAALIFFGCAQSGQTDVSVFDQPAKFLRRRTMKLAELAQQASQTVKTSSQQTQPFRCAQLGKSNSQIDLAGVVQLS